MAIVYFAAPLFETQCSFVNATPGQFLRWAEGQTRTEDVGAFCDYQKEEYWAYADYKYIAEVFEGQPSMFEVTNDTVVTPRDQGNVDVTEKVPHLPRGKEA